MHEAGKGREIKPSLSNVPLYELSFLGFGEWKTELIPADALGFQLKSRGLLEAGACDPKLPFIQVGVADLTNLVVVNDGYSGFAASC
jgi:hypothetical protein